VDKQDFEVIEEYELMGEKRFRVRLKQTNLVFNVAASSREEAIEKALNIARSLEIEKVLDKLRSLFES